MGAGMSAADEAYQAAEAVIAEAKRTGAEELSFDSDEFQALDHVPPVVGALESLRSLDLSNTQVSDLSPLAGMTALGTLLLDNTQVSDLSPLAGMTGLESLRFSRTKVSDLSPIAGLTRLRSLWLSSTQVSDLSWIGGLTGLRTLTCDHTHIRDLSPLAGLIRLDWLSLDGTQVDNLSPLARLTDLETLMLMGTQVNDLLPLTGLKSLSTLWLENTQVRDLRPLRGMRKLAEDPVIIGLTFKGIPATADPRIAEIAEIADDKERATALLALLDAGWEPPGVLEPVALEPDPLLRSILVDGKLEIAADPPTEEERRDRVKVALHDRLRDKAGTLAALAGNRFPRLANRARALAALLDKPFVELDLLSVHRKRCIDPMFQ